MYILLTLFAISLTGIIVMIGKKLAIIEDIHLMEMEREFMHPFVPDLEKIKSWVVENGKKLGHASVVFALRFHIRFSNLLKIIYETMKLKIKNINMKNNPNGESIEKVEVSKFLKKISDYKDKIREIKHKIHEEENNS